MNCSLECLLLALAKNFIWSSWVQKKWNLMRLRLLDEIWVLCSTKSFVLWWIWIFHYGFFLSSRFLKGFTLSAPFIRMNIIKKCQKMSGWGRRRLGVEFKVFGLLLPLLGWCWQALSWFNIWLLDVDFPKNKWKMSWMTKWWILYLIWVLFHALLSVLLGRSECWTILKKLNIVAFHWIKSLT